MKKDKSKWQYILILVLVILLILIIYFYFNSSNDTTVKGSNYATGSNSTTATEENASIQTITNTLSGSGEVQSALTEKLSLHATYDFQEIYAEKNQYIAAGDKILEYTNGTYMTAPYNLVVTDINVPSEGEECTNKNYIEVSSTDTLTLDINVNEKNIQSVKVGQEVDVTIPALNNAIYKGNITHVSETGTYSSDGSTFLATVTIQNDGKIKIGMTATYEVVLEKAENVVTVPVEAVQKSGDTKYVNVIDDNGNINKVTVTTGISNDAYIEIKSGLQGTEKIQVIKTTTSNTNAKSFMPQNNSKNTKSSSNSQNNVNSTSNIQGQQEDSNIVKDNLK